MDKLLTKHNYEDGLNYQILGPEAGARQTLQIILMPEQAVVVHDRAILYKSENVKDETDGLQQHQGGLFAVLSLTFSFIGYFLSRGLYYFNIVIGELFG